MQQGDAQQGTPDGFGPPPPGYPPAPPGFPPAPPVPVYGSPAYGAPPYGAPAYGEPPYDGPEFLAADARSGLVVAASGVQFTLGDAGVDFAWTEVHQIHLMPAGRVLKVAVRLPDGRLFECVVDARKAARAQAWAAELSAVIQHYRPIPLF